MLREFAEKFKDPWLYTMGFIVFLALWTAILVLLPKSQPRDFYREIIALSIFLGLILGKFVPRPAWFPGPKVDQGPKSAESDSQSDAAGQDPND